MKNKNILICLERLNIGGVETAVLNLANSFLEKGHKVIVLAKEGLYTEKLETKGAVCINFEFGLENNFNKERISKIIEIIKKYNIDEVHIHHIPCLLSAFISCLLTNTPYIAYAHNSIQGVYEWFMNTFCIYKAIIPYYYKYAHKIIAITDNVKSDIINRFNIDKEKILVIPNSISFEESDRLITNIPTEITKFLLISRFSKEKGKSLYNAIDLFKEYKKKNKNSILQIAGDGELKEDLEKYIKEQQIEEYVHFLGAINNVLEHMNNVDIVLGLDRCILEAISMKRLAIVVGYDKLKQLITNKSMKQEMQENFSGHSLEEKTINDLVEELIKLTKKDIEKIVKDNYDFAKDKLNINNNIYTIPNEEKIEKCDIDAITSLIIKLQQLHQDELQKNVELQKGFAQAKQDQKCIEMKEERIRNLEQELKEVYSSKRWRYMDKILKIFH